MTPLNKASKFFALQSIDNPELYYTSWRQPVRIEDADTFDNKEGAMYYMKAVGIDGFYCIVEVEMTIIVREVT